MSQIVSSSSNMSVEKFQYYHDLLRKLAPLKESTEKQEKEAAMDFRIIIMSILNETNSLTLTLLNEGMINILTYFNRELDELIEGKVDWKNTYILNYDMIHDMACMIMQQILFKNRIDEVREIFMGF